jgi:hypothetical protein
MIKPSSEIWNEISVTNNLEFEFHNLGTRQPFTIIVAKDVFKYPDKVREFLLTFPYWATKDIEEKDTTVRPGLTAEIPPLFQTQFYKFLTTPLKKILGVHTIGVRDGYVNLEGGKMTLDRSSCCCCYPHVDNELDDPDYLQMHIAANINLSQSPDPVRTGFWSWMGRNNWMDMNRDEANALNNFYDRHEDAKADSWFQMEDYEHFRLEDAVQMQYNDLVMYSTMQFHNPYIQPEWHRDYDRMMLTAFLTVYPDALDFPDSDLNTVGATWEAFRLNSVHNYHPQYTSVLN